MPENKPDTDSLKPDPQAPAPEETADAKADSSAPEESDAAAAADSATTPEAAGDEFSGLLQKVDELTLEANAARDRALRATAELENFRKRAVREKDETRRFANQMLLENFLPILDNFALGLQAARQHEAGKPFAEGFAMVLTQIEAWLQSHGVDRIAPEGAPFDPNFHEAVGHAASETVPEGHVAEVHRVGYRMHDRLLRPAVVVVSSGAADAGENEKATD
ncbi:MAG: nucleotide exchange factor GrpE [Verrucomicrobiota bacterium]